MQPVSINLEFLKLLNPQEKKGLTPFCLCLNLPK